MLATLYISVVLLGIPVAAFWAWLWFQSRTGIFAAAALAWLVPPAYEGLVQATCTGDCNIRVDLLLILPLEVVGLGWLSMQALQRLFDVDEDL